MAWVCLSAVAVCQGCQNSFTKNDLNLGDNCISVKYDFEKKKICWSELLTVRFSDKDCEFLQDK